MSSMMMVPDPLSCIHSTQTVRFHSLALGQYRYANQVGLGKELAQLDLHENKSYDIQQTASPKARLLTYTCI
jgi:hypothetical protein